MTSDVEAKRIDLALLQPHPANPNVVPAELLAKLKGHIERTGRYPPLIVRPMGDAYQILDGHHRALVLAELGQTTARCDVWPVDDDEALLLVGTLNRLAGDDDVQKRARLIAELKERFGAEHLATLLPESSAEIEKLASLTAPPAPAAAAPALGDMPTALTFFLTDEQRRGVLAALAELHADRTQALLLALTLTEPVDGEAQR
jgi:ParB-like chromosome segregation protein Spo0J